jgi:hypothetical protein
MLFVAVEKVVGGAKQHAPAAPAGEPALAGPASTHGGH